MEKREKQTDLYQLILPGEQYFTYSIAPYQIMNFLGATAAVLSEYAIESRDGVVYKLYKTQEGNWYDLTAETNAEKNKIFHLLKAAIEKKENE